MLLDRREIELRDGATYAFDLTSGMGIAWDCQKEAGAATRITFDAAKDNIVSLMVKRDGGKGGVGSLVVREEIAVPEFDRSHTENHSTWTLRIGGQHGDVAENGLLLPTENGALLEEPYEAVGVCRNREMDVTLERMESQDEALENNWVEEEVAVAEIAVSYEDQATLKIRQTPPPPLPPKRNGRKMGENEAETGEEDFGTNNCRIQRSRNSGRSLDNMSQEHLNVE